MDLCLTRICDFRNVTPRYVNYHNVVLLISQPKDEDYLDLMRLYEELECRLTVLFSFKYHNDMGLFEEVWNMGYKQDQTPVYVEIFSDLAEAFETLYSSCIKPTIIITDDESNGDIIKKNCAWYFVYPFKKVHSRNDMKPMEALCLAPLDYDKIPEPRLYANTYAFDNTRVTVSDIIENMPKCHILFTALGCFKRNYNYAIIISAFTDFMRKSNKIFGHKVMLVLHGTSDRRDDKFRRELRRQVLNTPFKKNIILLKKDLNDKEKKALLRMSYALIYLNGGMEPTSDLRLSLLVGTPVIALNKGYAKHVCKNGVTGLMMSKLEVTKLSLHMQNMTEPSTYQYFSNATREYFLYEHSFMKYTIDAFDKEDSPALRRKGPIKGYRYHSNTATELVVMESETIIELIPRISDMDSVDGAPESGKSTGKSKYPSKAIEVLSAQVNKQDAKTLPTKKVSSTRMIQSHSKESKKEAEQRGGKDSKEKTSKKNKKPSKTKLLIDLMINDLYEKEEESEVSQDSPRELVEELNKIDLELMKKKSSEKVIPKVIISKKEEKPSPIPPKKVLSPKPGPSNVPKQKTPLKKPDKPQPNLKTSLVKSDSNNNNNNNNKPSNNKKTKKHKDSKNSSSVKLQAVVPQRKLKKSESHNKAHTNKERRRNIHTQSTTTELNAGSTSKLEPPPPLPKLPEKQVKEKKVQTYYNPPEDPEMDQCASLKLGLFSNTERYLEKLNRQK